MMIENPESEKALANTAIYREDLDRLRMLKKKLGKSHVRLISEALDLYEKTANGGQVSSVGTEGAAGVGGSLDSPG